MKPNSPQKRREVLKQLGTGLSTCQVAANIGISHSMVSKIKKASGKEFPAAKRGRKRKLNDCHIAWINRHIERSSKTTLHQACNEVLQQLKIKVSPATLQKALLFNNFRVRKIVNKPLLMTKHKQDRLQWAPDHKDWTVNDWKAVVWSDETKINCLGSDGKQHCWIKGAGFNSKLVCPTLKFGSGGIMVWGCMTYRGVGTLHVIKEKMTPNTQPMTPKNGSNTMISTSWTGLHSLQTSIPSNICGQS